MLKRIFTTFRGSRKRASYTVARKGVGGWRRGVRHERLEDRCMLATLTVNLDTDTVPTNDGNLSLREAIAYVSGTAIPFSLDLASGRIQGQLGQNDTIQFDSNLINDTITITGGTLVVKRRVSIIGLGGTLTIAGFNSPAAAFDFDMDSVAPQGASSVSGLEITGFGSAIRVSNMRAGDSLTVAGNELRNNTNGVEIIDTTFSSVTINGNNQIHNNQYGIQVNGPAGAADPFGVSVNIGGNNAIYNNALSGIYAHGVGTSSTEPRLTITNNFIYGNGVGSTSDGGIRIQSSQIPLTISNNGIGRYAAVSGGGSANRHGIIIADNDTNAPSTISSNVLSGNQLAGIFLAASNMPNLEIVSNAIGTNALGGVADVLPNSRGIEVVQGSVFEFIRSNTIAVNTNSGISFHTGVNGGVVQLNTITGNGGDGISVGDLVNDLLIEANVFTFNGGAGVFVEDSAGVANAIISNSFSGNGGQPVDLEDPLHPGPGFTPNDQDDSDNGPNRLINYPQILNSARLANGSWRVNFAIDVDQPGEYLIQFSEYDPSFATIVPLQDPSTLEFASSIVEVASVGEGFDFVGHADIEQRFVSSALGALDPGNALTANLTGYNGANAGNTSEFAPAIVLDAAPPRVTDVRLDSTLWASVPLVYSYASIVPTGKQLAPIFTQNVNQLQVVFSEDVQLSQLTNANVKLFGSNGTLITLPASPAYNAANHTATWTLGFVLPADKYRLEISTAVTDLAGKPLDGEWMNITNGTPDNFADDPTGRTFTSGDGNPGSTNNRFEFWFSLLPGDRNQDGIVDNSDLSAAGDVNGDGLSNSADTSIVQSIITTNTTISLPLRDRLVAYANRGDYNDNEIVDQSDYALWKASFGDVGNLPADGSGNGVVDAADYSPWRDNLGKYSAWYTGPIPPSGGGGFGGVPVFDPDNIPRVANVTISGSGSTHAPFSFNGPDDNTDFDGSGIQLRTVPVGGADTISITFTEDVNITADTLKLTGMRTGNRPTLADFHYDLGTMTASWRFTGWTFGDQYLISLSDAVTDVEGNSLDGEWTNPIQLSTVNAAVSEFPSGNGYAGGDFNFVATLLPGDANLDLIVDISDFLIWNSNASYVAGKLFTQGDFNGDGMVTSSDLPLWQANYGRNLTGPLTLLADLNGDWQVDDDDLDILAANIGIANPTQAQGNLDGDTDIDIHDLDLMFAQYGLELAVVS